MSKIKALGLYTLGFLSALLLIALHDYYTENTIQVIQGDYEVPDYSLFAGVSAVQPKFENLPVIQEAEVQIVEAPEPEPEPIDLGEFRITYYCGCEQCCGKWAAYHTTFTGTIPTENHTVAVDPDIIPLGTTLEINGQLYIAEDIGAFKGEIIDIYVPKHEMAFELAAKNGDYAEVYIKEDI